jgi:hypothetical protein
MRQVVVAAVGVCAVGGIFWAMVSGLEDGSSHREEPPAVILRAPEGFVLEAMGASTFEAAAGALRRAAGDRVGIEFSHDGDRVILLADRGEQVITEMRAARSGTLVERTWSGEVGQRLAWAVVNGNLDAPGLPPATGKNLYH